jgi:hypothetical protein
VKPLPGSVVYLGLLLIACSVADVVVEAEKTVVRHDLNQERGNE